MKRSINPAWIAEMKSKILQGLEIDTTQSFLPCIQWLIIQLSNYGKPYKLYDLGAGVKRLTTNTTTCPCCKKEL